MTNIIYFYFLIYANSILKFYWITSVNGKLQSTICFNSAISFFFIIFHMLNVMKIIQKRQDSILSDKKRKMRLQVKSNFFWHLRPKCSNEFESKCSFITCRHGLILEGTEINCIWEFYYVLCIEDENKKVFFFKMNSNV